LWRDRIIGAGVSLPGLVDVEKGISCSSTNMPNWRQVQIVSKLTSALRLPVRIERSIHLAALSEKWRRPDTYHRNVLCVVLRTGIGAAMLIKGNVYAGANNLDGEIGHTIIDIEGKRCECGKRGCLETFISSDAIRGKAIELIRQGKAKRLFELADGKPEAISTEMIYKLSQEGDVDCIQIVRYLMRYLCYGITNLVNVFDPHELVICGSIDIAEDIVLQEMNSHLKELLLPDTFSKLKIYLTPYKERASLIGAACMVFENYNPR
jgi:predicted NBD/HSP70 family sugar kinase